MRHQRPKHYGAGSSPAVWTATAVILVGGLVVVFAHYAGAPQLAAVGGGLGLLGLGVGALMALAGYGTVTTGRGDPR